MKINELIGNNVKSLNLEKEENWQEEMNKGINTIIHHCEQNNSIPFLSFIACNCGCGKIMHTANPTIISKQKLPEFLEDAAKIIREQNKNLN